MSEALGEPRTLSDTALSKLREAILSGDSPPGERVRLQDQAELLGMSSVPIREALRSLERSGLIDRTPHRGAHVAEMTAQDLEETYTIRLELESMAVRLAANRMTEKDRSSLRQLLDRYKDAAEQGGSEALQLHNELHFSLYRLSGSKWLLRLLPMLWDNSERYRRQLPPLKGEEQWRVVEHWQIFQACAAGDAEAAEAALREHLRGSLGATVDRLRRDEALFVHDENRDSS